MKKIICPLLISIDNLKIYHQDAFSFLISCLVLEILVMSSTHAFEMRFGKKRISLKNPIKFIQIFYEYAPTLYYHTCVKFE